MAIIIAALFLLNLNVALAAGGDNTWHSPASATTLSSSLGSIGGYMWIDDGDMIGIQESDEVGINDIELELWLDDRDGVFELGEDTPKPSVFTQDDDTGNPGRYLFDGLSAGTYFVRIAPAEFDPGGTLEDYNPTAPNQGDDDTVDSDGDNPECPYDPNLGSHTCLGGDSQYEDNILAMVTLTENAGNVSDDLTTDFGVGHAASHTEQEPTAVTLSSFMASSASRGVSSQWPWLAVLTALAAGGTLWIRRR